MARNPYFDETLAKMLRIHDAKNEDYAAGDNPFANFEITAKASGLSVDRVLLTMIGVKTARLVSLLGNEADPNFESIDDSILDLANYAAIWHAWRKREASHQREAQMIADEHDHLLRQQAGIEPVEHWTGRTADEIDKPLTVQDFGNVVDLTSKLRDKLRDRPWHPSDQEDPS